MKKFLFCMAILLLNASHQAHALFCAKPSACQISKGFLEQQKAKCAGPTTPCRRAFCENVCAPCPIASDIRALCQNNCTGILFSNGEDLHDRLEACFGHAASLDAVTAVTSGTEDAQLLAGAIPDLIKQYEVKVSTQEKYLGKAQQARKETAEIEAQINTAAIKLYPDNKAAALAAAKSLMSAINTRIQHEEGTYTAADTDPIVGASRKASRRASLRQSR